MNDAGWIVSDPENNISQCPHCHVQYSKWKAGDDPRMIHRFLAPLCPFVLAENPSSSYSIPQNSTENVYTNDFIRNADTQPYDGVVRTKDHPYSIVTNRQNSFARFPRNHLIDTRQLANQGFYYVPFPSCIKCFYCSYTLPIQNVGMRSAPVIKLLHLHFGCRYGEQVNDHDPTPSIAQSRFRMRLFLIDIISFIAYTKTCAWCSTEDKCAFALPCRHFSICQSCSLTKQLCLTCHKPVTAYLRVFPS